ncbi:hypothetical protein BDV35DRAFT_370180 [Aspergillus flavus]|uniref:Uncharacterized protein n=1 Tax=Aspergillus flavus TaxID=5059 RepID=A0A5N6GFZ3_ASPFL|nr:hypothetical protein BDV35DRAFT_370180 [Aspergillus flavus]
MQGQAKLVCISSRLLGPNMIGHCAVLACWLMSGSVCLHMHVEDYARHGRVCSVVFRMIDGLS